MAQCRLQCKYKNKMEIKNIINIAALALVKNNICKLHIM